MFGYETEVAYLPPRDRFLWETYFNQMQTPEEPIHLGGRILLAFGSIRRKTAHINFQFYLVEPK